MAKKEKYILEYNCGDNIWEIVDEFANPNDIFKYVENNQQNALYFRLYINERYSYIDFGNKPKEYRYIKY